MVLNGRRESRPLLVAVVGPTATGKSSLAVKLSLELQGEIVNCDSMQTIRHLNIGTAKPGEEERRLVRHHLYDIIEPTEYYSAGRYMKNARDICERISERGHLPIVVGGTGLYLRALLEGLFQGPGKSTNIRDRLRKIADREGLNRLYEMLTEQDPKAAEKIEESDAVRIIRALEVMLVSGRKMSDLQSMRSSWSYFRVVKLGLKMPRQKLYDRINRRVERMFEEGLMEEVETLLGRGISPSAKGFEALGYRYAIDVLQGSLDVSEAIELTQRDTRRYAKRQMTWFKKEAIDAWIEGPGDRPEAFDEAIELLEKKE